MSADLQIQKQRAEDLRDILLDFVEIAENDHGDLYVDMTVDMVLDALGCLSLTLQPGDDAGRAYLDAVISRTKLDN